MNIAELHQLGMLSDAGSACTWASICAACSVCKRRHVGEKGGLDLPDITLHTCLGHNAVCSEEDLSFLGVHSLHGSRSFNPIMPSTLSASYKCVYTGCRSPLLYTAGVSKGIRAPCWASEIEVPRQRLPQGATAQALSMLSNKLFILHCNRAIDNRTYSRRRRHRNEYHYIFFAFQITLLNMNEMRIANDD